MTWGLLNFAMLAGLAGAAIPLLIHLLSRRRDPVIDWGAMQFLELGTWQRRRLNLADLLLLLARMGLVALVALALARPYWMPLATATSNAGAAGRRDVVLVIDGSSSMARKSGEKTGRDLALTWSRDLIGKLNPGDSIAVLIAKDRIRPLVDPPSFDFAKVETALAQTPPPRGSSDLAVGVGEAFRILETTHNPNREVIILTDDQRSAWRPGETDRWALLRTLRSRMPVPPRIWAVSLLGSEKPSETGTNASVGPLRLPRGAIVPGRSLSISTELFNAGPGALTRSVELLVDGKPEPGSTQVMGPIPASGRTPLNFRTTLETPGDHLLTVRLGPGIDPIPGDDESSRAVTVASSVSVLLVDGEPSMQALGGEVAFLRAALAPNGDETRVVATRTIDARRFDVGTLKDQKVVVLANIDRLNSELASALENFIALGGGVMLVPGSRTDERWWNENTARWLPAKIGEMKGDPAGKTPIAHPAAASFTGSALEPLGAGDNPTLAEAGFFCYRALVPNPGASALARLDTGDPWIVLKPFGKGKAMMVATPLDAEGGTLPVNPDFVPLAHEMVSEIGEVSDQGKQVKAGETVTFSVPKLAADVEHLTVQTPDGRSLDTPVVRGGSTATLRVSDTSEPGVYRLDLPPEAGGPQFAVVESDPRESDPAALERVEAASLAEGWPLTFESDAKTATSNVLLAATSRKHEVWRSLIYVAMFALCGEIWLTRRTARSRGV